jgi:hypothetical protein
MATGFIPQFSCTAMVGRMSNNDKQRFLAKWNELNNAMNGELRDDSRLAFSYCSGSLPKCWAQAWVIDDLNAAKERQNSTLHKQLASTCIKFLEEYLKHQYSSDLTRENITVLAKKYGSTFARLFYINQTNMNDVQVELNLLFPRWK